MRKSLEKIQSVDWASPKMVQVYQEKMASFKPVMRHFFTEKRREPLAWFTMRLNYARSVAVTSIVGYMVGLGDRHCSNILIDTETGEFVQIDFGIVFDEVSWPCWSWLTVSRARSSVFLKRCPSASPTMSSMASASQVSMAHSVAAPSRHFEFFVTRRN